MLNLFALAVIVAVSFGAHAGEAPEVECTKAWAAQGTVTGSGSILGLGLSSNPEKVRAVQESKNRALQDAVLQLRSNVESKAKLSETEATTAFESMVNVSAGMDSLVGVRVVKEGKNAAEKITHCSVVRFDVRAAYSEPKGRMNVLQKKTIDAENAVKARKWIAVIRASALAQKAIQEAQPEIARADVLKTFLNEPGPSWQERFMTRKVELEKAESEAREHVSFVLPASGFEGALAEVESQLQGAGFEVTQDRKSVAADRSVVLLELKSTGNSRKTKTALGLTLVSKVGVVLRDGQTRKELASNRGVSITGVAPSGELDDAEASVERQLVTHILAVIRTGLPGLLQE